MQAPFGYITSPPGYSTTSRSCASTALNQQFEAILERDHVGVGVLVEFEGVGHNLDTPRPLGLVFAHLEADPEVARVFGHTAKGVHGAIGVGLAVVLQPQF